MTTLLTTTAPDVAPALDGLAAAAEQARDDARTRAVLALVVERLEQATGATLGDAAGDPLVVLQRRFGRAHARLAEQPAPGVHGDLLLGLARALQPERAADLPRAPRPAAAAVLVGC